MLFTYICEELTEEANQKARHSLQPETLTNPEKPIVVSSGRNYRFLINTKLWTQCSTTSHSLTDSPMPSGLLLSQDFLFQPFPPTWGGGDFSPVEFTRIRAILHSPPLHKTLFTDERPPARGTCIPSVHPDYLK